MGVAMNTALRFMLCAASVAVLCLVPATLFAQTGWAAPPIPTGDATIGPAAGNQTYPHIEKGGDMYLAVWIDDRTSIPGDSADYATGRDIYAARLDADGVPIDTVPMVLCDDIGDQFQPNASWNGSNWLVTWYSWAPIVPGPGYATGLQAVRVSPAGEVLDDPPFDPYPNPIGGVDYLCTASDGTDWVVFLSEEVYNGFDTDYYLRGARISNDGVPIGTPPNLFSPECCYFFPLGSDAAYADGTYLVVFECIPDIYAHDAICGMRFTQGLGNIDDYPFEISLSDDIFRLPLVATDGQDFFVGWYHYVDYPPTLLDPFGGRVTAGGVSLDPDGIDLAGGVGSGADRRPRVAFDGTNWLAVWPDDQGARAARITKSGVDLDPGGVALPGYGVNDIADLTDGARIVWSSDAAGGGRPYDAYQTHLSGDLTADPETPIALGAPSHIYADEASGDGEIMIVFRSDVSGSNRIMAQTTTDYDDSGRAEPVLVASGPLLTDPEVAWNGSLYLVVWSDPGSGKILGSRMMPDGTIVDDPPIDIMMGTEPDVAAVEGNFLVVCIREVGSPTIHMPYGVRVRGSDGAVLDGSPIYLGTAYAKGPKVAGMINRWIVTWERRVNSTSEEASVWAAFVDTDGTTSGEFGIATNQSTSAYHYSPAVASSPAIALILWQDNREYPAYDPDWNIYGRRVRVDGVVFDDPDGFPVAASSSDEQNADVAYNGLTFQAVYEVSNEVGYFNRSTSDVYGSRIDLNGGVINPPTFAIEATDASEVMPAVAGGDNESVVATSVFMKEAPYASYRLDFQTLSDGVTGVSESDVVENEVRLVGAFPNPTAGSTTIRFALPEKAAVSLLIYDVAGRLVRRLDQGEAAAGVNDVVWDGFDDTGHEVANGLYLYKLETGGYSGEGKLAIIR
jgi:hypothetical protein